MTATLLSIVLTLGVIPVLWCGMVYYARAVFWHQPLSDSIEKCTLMIMVMASLCGVFALLIRAVWPQAVVLDSITLLPLITTEIATLHTIGIDTVLVVLIVLYLFEMIRRGILLRRVSHQFDTIAHHASINSDPSGYCITAKNVSPFVSSAGIIVLPRQLLLHLNCVQQQLIVAHERTHLQRRDPVYFLVMAWLEQIGWFNPFLRKQLRRCRLAAELACDHAVIRQHTQQRRTYAETLVAVLRLFPDAAPLSCPTVMPTTEQGDAAMRIKQIMTNQQPTHHLNARVSYWLAIVLVLPLLGVQLVFSATPANEQAQHVRATTQNADAHTTAIAAQVAPSVGSEKLTALLAEARERQNRHRLHNQQVFTSTLFTVNNEPLSILAVKAKKDEC